MDLKTKGFLGLFAAIFIFISALFFVDFFYFRRPLPGFIYSVLGKNKPDIVKCKPICSAESDLYQTGNIAACCEPGTVERISQ